MLHEVAIRVRSVRHLPQAFYQQERKRELALSKGSPGGEQQQLGGRRQGDHRRCLRAQATLVDQTRETGNSVRGRGLKSREIAWLRGSDTLVWRLEEHDFKKVKAYTPSCKVYIYSTDKDTPLMETSDSVGWFTVDTRDLAGKRLEQDRWVRLQGASPAEVLVSCRLSMVR
ncbi:unnamed protein product, partial [Choristocarpus tenellus]